NARDLVALRLALEQIPTLKTTIQNLVAADVRRLSLKEKSENLITPAATNEVKNAPTKAFGLLQTLESQLSESPDLVELISRAIVDEPPLPIKEGGMIRDGFDAALDELRNAQRGGKDWIAKLQADEIASTGISSLKA